MPVFVNLCPHPIQVGRTIIEPSGTVARASFDRGRTEVIDGVRCCRAHKNKGLRLEGAPLPVDLDDPEVLFIVSQQVGMRYPRPNFLVPGKRITGPNNEVAACTELVFTL